MFPAFKIIKTILYLLLTLKKLKKTLLLLSVAPKLVGAPLASKISKMCPLATKILTHVNFVYFLI